MKVTKVLYALFLLFISVFLHVSSVFATTPSISAPPSVTRPDPSDNPLAYSVEITFNTPMDSSTVTTSSFYIKDSAGNKAAISNPVATNSGATFTIGTVKSLSPCETYTVVVTTAVKSADTQTSLAAEYSSATFTAITDSTPPSIVLTSPVSSATEALETSEIQVTFDRIMNPSSINSSTFYLTPSPSGPTVAGAITTTTTMGNATVAIFRPTYALPGPAMYTATVTNGVQSACGVSMAAPRTWDFSVRDVLAPFIVSTFPSKDSSTALRTTDIIINFNEPMQTISGSNISVSRTSPTAPVSGSVNFNSASKLSATFRLNSPLELGTEYTVTVTGVRSVANNNPMTTNPYSFSFTTVTQDIAQYCNIPTSVSRKSVQPNVLLIMDNSNSMDEGFEGDALGSYHPDSKSVVGKVALSDIVNTYSDVMRIGLMTYNLPTSQKRHINNSPYFVSYEARSYCPNPSAATKEACNNYCIGDTSYRTACGTGCRAGNPSFDETYMDEIIAARTAYSDQRKKYCNLVYPKTKTLAAGTVTAYYKAALPMYSSNVDPVVFIYGTGYSPAQEITNTSTSTGTYAMWRAKTGQTDTNSGYSNSAGSSSFQATDSDIALGYGSFGRRMITTYTGQTWFAEGSPGGGYLQVGVASNDATNTQKNLLLNKLVSHSGNEAGYMACGSTSNPNTCPYIVNAGLTPTAGTLQTAINYFKGGTSPIQESCQNNYIVYVTDGLPSVDPSGANKTSAQLINDVLLKLKDLQKIQKTLTPSGPLYTFPVKTYIVGLGMGEADRAMLERMAEEGRAGELFLANNRAELANALKRVFSDITTQTSSGTSASVTNNRGESGSNIFMADFHPRKEFIADSGAITELKWIGELQNLWYYLDPYMSLSTVREDTNSDGYLDLKEDFAISTEFDSGANSTLTRWYQDTTGYGTAFVNIGGRSSPDEIRALWRAGALLHARPAQGRNIYSTVDDHNSSYNLVSYPAASGLTAFNIHASTLFSSRMGTAADTKDIIEYIRGVDDPKYRSRFVEIKYPTTGNPTSPLSGTVPKSNDDPSVGVWKLGDIVSSTPQSLTAKQLHAFDGAYSDQSYAKFYNSDQYNNRNMVFVGANDGMLHAFRVGKVTRPPYNASLPFRISKIEARDIALNIGDEEWAFIPKNALPYLKYLTDPDYNHMYFVDSTVRLLDASINAPNTTATGCTRTEYWKCNKITTYSDSTKKILDFRNTSWRTILIGGMGMGGASRDKDGHCNNPDGSTPTNAAAESRQDCVKSPVNKVGLSSFFALDVTEPASPKFMWEFSDALDDLAPNDKGLGYALSGPAFVRISARQNLPPNESYGAPNLSLNGRWFAVFATGSSGPINTATNQFMGKSDNTLKVYVVDVNPNMTSGWEKGVNYWVLDSGIKNAFAGDINGSVVDVDRRSPYSNGYYSDDVVYIGYTRPDVATTAFAEDAGTKWHQADVNASSKWTEGGVLRLLTNDSLNPDHWTLSTMIDGVGPVTTAVATLQDRERKKLWIYFGSGRFYYRDEAGADDPSNRRYLVGVEDTCYASTNSMNAGFKLNSYGTAWEKQGCSVNAPPPLTLNDLHDQSVTIDNQIPIGKKGWSIKLDPQDPTTAYVHDAERVITNTAATSNGLVLFTTFKPSGGVCDFGGTSFLRIVDYANGGIPPKAALRGKVLVQLSNGQFIAVDISLAAGLGGTGGIGGVGPGGFTVGPGGIIVTLGSGQVGRDKASIQTPPKPIKRILHITEK